MEPILFAIGCGVSFLVLSGIYVYGRSVFPAEPEREELPRDAATPVV